MKIHTYEIGSDDEVVFTRRLVSKLPTTTKPIPKDAAEINLNTTDKQLRSDIEAVYGSILKYYTVYIDENETVYFEPNQRLLNKQKRKSN